MSPSKARQFKVNINVDDRTIELSESLEVNYKDGEANQLATMYLRGMMALGHDVSTATVAIFKALGMPGNFSSGDDLQESLFRTSLEKE
jgi:hypothetical protein